MPKIERREVASAPATTTPPPASLEDLHPARRQRFLGDTRIAAERGNPIDPNAAELTVKK